MVTREIIINHKDHQIFQNISQEELRVLDDKLGISIEEP